MIELPLRGRTGLKALLDEEDAAVLEGRPWRPLRQGVLTYARIDEEVNGARKTVYLHREVAALIHGREAILGRFVDHENGDGLDCRRRNLRLCTHAENCFNQFKRKHGTSPYKGVAWHVIRCSWITQIRVGRVRKWLGDFDDERAAAQVHDVAALHMHGRTARLNFPELEPAYNLVRQGLAAEGVLEEARQAVLRRVLRA